MENIYSMIHRLRKICQMEGQDFIAEVYRQLLKREPDSQGLIHHVHLLSSGISKTSIISGILGSVEANSLYQSAPVLNANSRPAIADIIQNLMIINNFFYVQGVYRELLCRYPDAAEMNAPLLLLNRGLPRIQFIQDVLQSNECTQLLHSAHSPIQVNSIRAAKHVGFFLGFTDVLDLSGEGIGRFSARLVQGLLARSQDVIIHIATTKANEQGFQGLFGKQLSEYPERVRIQTFDNVEWLNKNCLADVWIVPYVGLDLALGLEKPVILCLHDLVYLHFKEIYFARHQDFCHRLESIVYRMANKASKVVFHSHFVKEHEGLRFLGLPEEKTKVIRLAAPVEEYGSVKISEENEFRRKYNLFGDYLVFPSVIRYHKNHDNLIEAFLKFRQTPEGSTSKLQLVFTDHYIYNLKHAEISEILNRHPDNERKSVIFLGRISSSDLPSLYRYAKGTIVPTLFEGSCPFPIFESLIMDTPVAVSHIGVTQEVIGDMEVFAAFDPYSIHDIERAIRELWLNNELLLARQKAAISAAMKRTWSDVAGEYDEVVNMVLEVSKN